MAEGQKRVTTGFAFSLQPTSERTLTYEANCITRSSFGEPRMLAVTFAVRRLEYHSAPAET
jgi:hypothetical protein